MTLQLALAAAAVLLASFLLYRTLKAVVAGAMKLLLFLLSVGLVLGAIYWGLAGHLGSPVQQPGSVVESPPPAGGAHEPR